MYTKLAMIEETLKRKQNEQSLEADSPGITLDMIQTILV